MAGMGERGNEGKEPKGGEKKESNVVSGRVGDEHMKSACTRWMVALRPMTELLCLRNGVNINNKRSMHHARKNMQEEE